MTKIFLAGATGAVGKPLCLLLMRAGFEVVGMTRSPDKAAALARLGIVPAIIDALDAAGLARAVAEARPEIVIHQLTDLPPGLDPKLLEPAIARNSRLRTEGTRNLVAAALAAGARRIIAQSVAFAYASGPEPALEEHPLDLVASGLRGVTVTGVAALERAVMETPGFAGVVLRYGRFYGPGTGFERPAGRAPVHVDAAAHAALLAIARGRPGLYNIAEEDGAVSSAKARRELGWDAGFRLGS